MTTPLIGRKRPQSTNKAGKPRLTVSQKASMMNVGSSTSNSNVTTQAGSSTSQPEGQGSNFSEIVANREDPV